MLSSAGENGITIDVPPDGSYLEEGETLPLMIYHTEGLAEPDSLEIVVRNLRGVELLRVREDQALVDGHLLSPVIFPSGFPEGLYQVDFFVYSNNENISQESRRYLRINAKPSIKRINTYPSQIRPGATVVLAADIDFPLGSGVPLQLWSVNGKRLALQDPDTGFYQWTAPEQEGIYSLKLELYPPVLEDQDLSNLPSPVFASTDVFVSSRISLNRFPLGPDSSYKEISHFSGDLLEEISKKSWEAKGTPQPVPGNALYGFLLEPNAFLQRNSFAFPLDKGRLAPFSVSLLMEWGREEPLGELFSTSSGTLFSFSLVKEIDGFVVEVVYGSQRMRWPVPGVFSEHGLLSFSFVPFGEDFLVYSYFDRKETGSVSLGFIPEGLSSEGETVLGRVETGSMIIDEYGVYVRDTLTRPSTDPAFTGPDIPDENAVENILAEGFRGIHLPPGWQWFDSVGVNGDSFPLFPGDGVLFESGSLISPLLEIPPGQSRCHLLANGTVEILREDSETPLFSCSSGTDDEINVRFLRRDGKLRISCREDFWLNFSDIPGNALRFRIRPGAADSVKVSGFHFYQSGQEEESLWDENSGRRIEDDWGL